MKSKLGTLFIALGVLALLGAARLFGYNQWDNARAEKAADAVLNQLEETLSSPRSSCPARAKRRRPPPRSPPRKKRTV